MATELPEEYGAAGLGASDIGDSPPGDVGFRLAGGLTIGNDGDQGHRFPPPEPVPPPPPEPVWHLGKATPGTLVAGETADHPMRAVHERAVMAPRIDRSSVVLLWHIARITAVVLLFAGIMIWFHI